MGAPTLPLWLWLGWGPSSPEGGQGEAGWVDRGHHEPAARSQPSVSRFTQQPWIIRCVSLKEEITPVDTKMEGWTSPVPQTHGTNDGNIALFPVRASLSARLSAGEASISQDCVFFLFLSLLCIPARRVRMMWLVEKWSPINRSAS